MCGSHVPSHFWNTQQVVRKTSANCKLRHRSGNILTFHPLLFAARILLKLKGLLGYCSVDHFEDWVMSCPMMPQMSTNALIEDEIVILRQLHRLLPPTFLVHLVVLAIRYVDRHFATTVSPTTNFTCSLGCSCLVYVYVHVHTPIDALIFLLLMQVCHALS
mmetsp:Transcript_12825/g.29977  ORF Transcript_12825/g.29977 Transcript_12825/m.29977 type:complete len:161 (+) Transcript_12825:1686-2168(+)